MKWNRIGEGFPELMGKDVLILLSHGIIATAEFTGGVWYDYKGDKLGENYSIIAWTEIPEIHLYPIEGKTYQHTNGNKYKVIHIANIEGGENYEPTVVYRGLNGKVWTRPVSDCNRSMTLCD